MAIGAWRSLYRILRDADLAEDAVQTALTTAWRELPALHNRDRFEPWLHRTLVNVCYAEAKRRRRWSANVLAMVPEPSQGFDETLTVHDRDHLERGFRRLPSEQRAVLVFHHYLGYTLAEVSDHLGIPVGTAKSRLRYATAARRGALEAGALTPSTSKERSALPPRATPIGSSRPSSKRVRPCCRIACWKRCGTTFIRCDNEPSSAPGGS